MRSKHQGASMKTSTLKNRKVQFALAIACAALTGCFSNSGNNPDDNNNAVASISGTLQGDASGGSSGSSSGSGWDGTVVTTHTLNADGSLGAAMDSATCNASGSFTIQTAARGEHEYIL